MKFADLLEVFREQSWFDLSMVKLFFPTETDGTIRSSLYRFAKEEKILQLRRGLYVFSSLWARKISNPQSLAGVIYQPSYLTERWALSWYGVIPEKTILFTSVSSRPTRSFKNKLGQFRYRTVKRELFTAYSKREDPLGSYFIASPEKALLDLFYLEGGEWTVERMESWRFNPMGVNNPRLENLADMYGAGRMGRAVKNWLEFCSQFEEGRIIE